MSNKNILPYIVGGILALIIVGAVSYMSKDKDDEPIIDVSDMIEFGEHPRFESNFGYLLSEQWKHTFAAQKAINESQGKEIDQEKLALSVIQDPSIGQQYYLSTIDVSDNSNHFLGIYSYDVETYNWERIYKETNVIDAPGSPTYRYDVYGYDDNRLIVKRASLDAVVEPCQEPLLTDKETVLIDGESTVIDSPVLAIDLKSPYSKWEKYMVPKEIIDDLEAKKAKCNE